MGHVDISVVYYAKELIEPISADIAWYQEEMLSEDMFWDLFPGVVWMVVFDRQKC